MRTLLLPLVLIGLVTGAMHSERPAAAVPRKGVAALASRPSPGKFGRWVNKRTKPLGAALQKVTPFRLVKVNRSRIGGCCFPPDTRISLPGGTTCAISALRVGQAVLSWNPATDALDTARVEALATVVHDSLRLLTFADGRTIAATADHPFWMNNAGWASLAPALTAARYATGATHLLRPGDRCLVFSSTARLTPTQLSHVTALTACGVATYTITRLSRGTVFFANGLAVGVEGDKRRTSRASQLFP